MGNRGVGSMVILEVKSGKQLISLSEPPVPGLAWKIVAAL